jgi:hypothetical protein
MQSNKRARRYKKRFVKVEKRRKKNSNERGHRKTEPKKYRN